MLPYDSATAGPNMPMDYARARANMVTNQLRPNRVEDPPLLDAMGSVGALVAGLLACGVGWSMADPIASLLLSLLVVYSAWSLLRQAARPANPSCNLELARRGTRSRVCRPAEMR